MKHHTDYIFIASVIFGSAVLMHIYDKRGKSFATEGTTNSGRVIKPKATCNRNFNTPEQVMKRAMMEMDRQIDLTNHPDVKSTMDRMEKNDMSMSKSNIMKSFKEGLLRDQVEKGVEKFRREGGDLLGPNSEEDTFTDEDEEILKGLTKGGATIGPMTPDIKAQFEKMMGPGPTMRGCGPNCKCVNNVCQGTNCFAAGLSCENTGIGKMLADGIKSVSDAIGTGLSRLAKGHNVFTDQPVFTATVNMPFIQPPNQIVITP